jgi:hypothetical protein
LQSLSYEDEDILSLSEICAENYNISFVYTLEEKLSRRISIRELSQNSSKPALLIVI